MKRFHLLLWSQKCLQAKSKQRCSLEAVHVWLNGCPANRGRSKLSTNCIVSKYYRNAWSLFLFVCKVSARTHIPYQLFLLSQSHQWGYFLSKRFIASQLFFDLPVFFVIPLRHPPPPPPNKSPLVGPGSASVVFGLGPVAGASSSFIFIYLFY